MNQKSKKINDIISQKRVNLHLFDHTKRQIWTIVGKEKEHWIDPESNFCSCPGYYFGMLKNKKSCYHLDSIHIAKQENKFETIKFSDDEYDNFVSGILDEL